MVLGDYNTFMLPSQYGGMLIGFVDHGYLAVWYLLENLCMIWMHGRSWSMGVCCQNFVVSDLECHTS